jgi:flagellar biosynthesis chaperone FliJ
MEFYKLKHIVEKKHKKIIEKINRQKKYGVINLTISIFQKFISLLSQFLYEQRDVISHVRGTYIASFSHQYLC